MPNQTTTITTVTVHGAVCGTLWMPAIRAWRQEEKTYTLRGDDAPFRPRVETIREALERTAAEDGDFQTAGKLTGDSYFEIQRRCGNHTSSRTYFVADFPEALAGVVDFDTYQDED